MREAYGCDCDGISHRSQSLIVSPRYSTTVQAVRGFRHVIKNITGVESESCPWRAFYHPLVREVLDLATLASEHAVNLAGGDLPAVLVDGFTLYTRCRNQTTAHFIRQRTQELKAKRPRK